MQFGGDAATVSAGFADAIAAAWRDTRRRSERFSSSSRVDRFLAAASSASVPTRTWSVDAAPATSAATVMAVTA